MPSTNSVYNIATGVMYTGDQLAGVAQPKYSSITRANPTIAGRTATVQVKTADTQGAPGVSQGLDAAYADKTIQSPNQPRKDF